MKMYKNQKELQMPNKSFIKTSQRHKSKFQQNCSTRKKKKKKDKTHNTKMSFSEATFKKYPR